MRKNAKSDAIVRAVVLLSLVVGIAAVDPVLPDPDADAERVDLEDFPLSSSTAQPDVRVLYNIGHMANDIRQADEFLRDGANALEVDVRFASNGLPSSLRHGFPCDCFRNCMRSEDFTTFLDHIRERSTPGSSSYTERLALLIFDLKLDDVDNHEAPLYAAGDAVATMLIEKLFLNGTSDTRIWILMGIPKVRHGPAFSGFRDAFVRLNQSLLLERVGYEVSDEKNMDEVQQMFRGLDIRRGIWQGDGITNCIAGRSDGRLRQAIGKRDAPSGPWVNVAKVYRWTIDTKAAMRHSLRLGVDGIMTNDPDDLAEVLAETEFKNRFRSANNTDNPFFKIRGSGPLRIGCSRNYCWKDCTYSGRWCWTAVSGCKADPDRCTVDLECAGSCGRKRRK